MSSSPPQFVSTFLPDSGHRETWRHADPVVADFRVLVNRNHVSLTIGDFNFLSRVDTLNVGADETATVFLPYALFVTQMTYWGWSLVMGEAPLV